MITWKMTPATSSSIAKFGSSSCGWVVERIWFLRCRLPSVASGQEQLLRRNVKRFRGGLVFEAHRLLYHSTLGLRVTEKKEKNGAVAAPGEPCPFFVFLFYIDLQPLEK